MLSNTTAHKWFESMLMYAKGLVHKENTRYKWERRKMSVPYKLCISCALVNFFSALFTRVFNIDVEFKKGAKQQGVCGVKKNTCCVGDRVEDTRQK